MGQHGTSLTTALQDFLTQWGFNPTPAGEFPPVGPSIVPTIELGSLLASVVGPEGRPWTVAPRIQTFAGGGTAAAVAARFSGIQIINPADSGVTIYVTSVYAVSILTANLSQEDTALANAITDLGSKSLGAPAPKATLFDGDQAAVNAPFLDQFFSDNANIPSDRGPRRYDDPWVLEEGEGLLLQDTTANSIMLGNFEWVELVNPA